MPKKKASGSAEPLTVEKTKSVLFVFFKGLITAFMNEGAFRREFIVAVIAIPVALYLDLAGVEKALMILCIMMIMILELANTAVESLADKISQKDHELLGKAKDVGSTAVGLMKITTITVWLLIIYG